MSQVVDIQAIPLAGDWSGAILPTPGVPVENLACDVLICGGGLGGIAAALAAAGSGARVCLFEETDWLGGQATSQGVSALDEHEWIETFGGTRSYEEFRMRIRKAYTEKFSVADAKLNPGECWVSSLGFEPGVALNVIKAMLTPYLEKGNLRIFLRTKIYGCGSDDCDIAFVDTLNLENGRSIRFQPQIVIDATELGDLLPLAGIPYRIGAESRKETGEPHAPLRGSANDVQGCTYPFVFEKCDSPQEPVSKPEGYESFLCGQPYSLKINIHGDEGTPLQYAMFEQLPGTPGSVWEYRRLVSGNRFRNAVNDLSMFNWPGNDYYETSLLDAAPDKLAQALQRAKQLSVGFAHWLQTKHGYLRLRPDIMGSKDGVSKHPYIREARRIVALRNVVEQDVHASFHAGARAQCFNDSVGIGFYALDVHHTCGGGKGFFVPTKPFQIPLAALLPAGGGNLIAGAKNIGVTHVTNGCYRLHPVEWNIGQTAGLLAAFCVKGGVLPKQVAFTPRLLRRFQRECLGSGIPCNWLIDIPPSHPRFAEIHFLVALAGPPDESSLEFRPDALLTPMLFETWCRKIQREFPDFSSVFKPVERWRFAVEAEQIITEYL